MIDPRYLDVPRKICARLNDGEVNWVITGSLGLALQGLPLEVHDIDVQTDKPGAYEIERRFSRFVVKRVTFFSA